MSGPLAIAVDGPVASGKSAVGRALAKRLGIGFLDTGMMYRAFTWAALRKGADPRDAAAVGRLAESLKMRVEIANGQERVLVDGQDATPFLKTLEVERAVSHVSAVSAVRRALVAMQRDIAGEGPVVMVGRDIGTVVLPDATLKVFLRASVEVRAKRRYLEMKQRGERAELEEVIAALARRDKIDTERADSPLTQADGSAVIDTDHLNIDQVVQRIIDLLGDQ